MGMESSSFTVSEDDDTCRDRKAALKNRYFNMVCKWDSIGATAKSSACMKFTNTRFKGIDPKSFRGRNFYFLGNSVLRHYSFSLWDYLSQQNTTEIVMDRREQKRKCVGALGSSSCEHKLPNDNFVRFMWMNAIGQMIDLTDPRDVCYSKSKIVPLGGCLSQVVSRATSKDVLILGAFPVDFSQHKFKGLGLIEKMKTIYTNVYESGVNTHSFVPVLKTVLQNFPGSVIYLSYPYLTKGWNVHNDNMHGINNITKCAVAKINNERLAYIDLRSIQEENYKLYSDYIHHEGALSKMVIQIIMAFLKNQK
jgi:hypothetical protein